MFKPYVKSNCIDCRKKELQRIYMNYGGIFQHANSRSNFNFNELLSEGGVTLIILFR